MSENHSVEGLVRVLSELQAARDGVRLQAHLFSLEARERWVELESSVAALEQRLKEDGGNGSLKAQARLSELSHRLSAFVSRHLSRGSTLKTAAYSIMSDGPRSCHPEDSLNVPVRIMWEADCGAVPVVNSEGRAVGVITDRDVCIGAYTQGKTLEACTVASAMSKQLHTCEIDTPAWRLLEIMRERQIHRVLVTDGDGTLRGLVALADIARHLKVMDDIAACAVLARTVAAISEARIQSDTLASRAAE